MGKKLICFDFDNTLVNGHYHHAMNRDVNTRKEGMGNGVILKADDKLIYNDTKQSIGSQLAENDYFNNKIEGLLLDKNTGLKHGQQMLECMRQAFKEGHKIAITSYTHYPEVITPVLRNLGLTENEIKQIVVVGGYPKEGVSKSMSVIEEHIQAAIDYLKEQDDKLEIDAKDVMLVDDSLANIAKAQKDGHQVVLVPQESNPNLSVNNYFKSIRDFIIGEKLQTDVTVNSAQNQSYPIYHPRQPARQNAPQVSTPANNSAQYGIRNHPNYFQRNQGGANAVDYQAREKILDVSNDISHAVANSKNIDELIGVIRKYDGVLLSKDGDQVVSGKHQIEIINHLRNNKDFSNFDFKNTKITSNYGLEVKVNELIAKEKKLMVQENQFETPKAISPESRSWPSHSIRDNPNFINNAKENNPNIPFNANANQPIHHNNIENEMYADFTRRINEAQNFDDIINFLKEPSNKDNIKNVVKNVDEVIDIIRKIKSDSGSDTNNLPHAFDIRKKISVLQEKENKIKKHIGELKHEYSSIRGGNNDGILNSFRTLMKSKENSFSSVGIKRDEQMEILARMLHQDQPASSDAADSYQYLCYQAIRDEVKSEKNKLKSALEILCEKKMDSLEKKHKNNNDFKSAIANKNTQKQIKDKSQIIKEEIDLRKDKLPSQNVKNARP